MLLVSYYKANDSCLMLAQPYKILQPTQIQLQLVKIENEITVGYLTNFFFKFKP